MDCLTILAQAAQASGEIEQGVEVVHVDKIYEQITSLSWLEAILAISFGVVYLLYGWRIFKVLAVISFALLGLFAGMWVGRQFDNEFLGGVLGLALLAILAVPLMRWAVCLLGAAAGGVLTAGLWYAFELPQQYIWAGALIGIIAGGMISFIIFKISVMLFSSLGGSAIMVSGILALLHHYPPTTEHVSNLTHNNNWFLPVALLAPTVIGVFVQNKFIKGAKDWGI